MSLIYTTPLRCPLCETEWEEEAASSVAAERRPDLRASILDDSFQRVTCPGCGAAARISPSLTYMDVERGKWILTLPAANRPHWESFEAGALEIFGDAFGAGAPPAGRALGERLVVRIAFGWPGLREKLLCEEFGIDDVELELCKLLLMRTVEAGNASDHKTLRLVGREADGALRMGWVHDQTELCSEFLAVPADLLDDIRADGAPWAALRTELTNGPFVDASKLLLEPEMPVEA